MLLKSASLNAAIDELNIAAKEIDNQNVLLEKKVLTQTLQIDKLIEKSKYLNEELDKLKKINKELNTRNEDTNRNYNNLEKKYNNQLKRIKRFEEIYNVVPGTTKEDKDRFLKFLAVNVLPSIISEAQSSTYKMVERHWNKYHTSKLQKVLSKHVAVENYTITSSILTFFTLLKDEDLFWDDLTGIIKRICNNTQEIYFDIDKLKQENVFVTNNKLGTEMTEEIVAIYNYYRKIYNNNSEKIKYPESISMALEEYSDVMYEALMKCD